MKNDRKEVKMYSDFKSPYAFLAFDPAFALETKYRVTIKWKPFQLRLKGKGERSQYSRTSTCTRSTSRSVRYEASSFNRHVWAPFIRMAVLPEFFAVATMNLSRSW